ncbi:hypothetical protein JFPO14_contig00017-0001 [Edwardsiella piscicida]|nr:putative transposase Tn5 [Edwardsiella piscicida]GAJ68593.1 putative transposase Tn5 [Edwardsiella piscicida]GBK56242.1 hypothetical protein JFPO13_contig000034-0040 [Edwardsiella piscicida]GBK59211.1 hypothetical protein JFPO14_contig00017-0001 [Edwardsiella piscicida]
MLLLYPELENILADNAKLGNARSPAEIAFSDTELKILDAMVKDTAQIMSSPPLEKYTIKLAQLGGYTGNKNKYPPGNIVIWHGLRRLNEIQIGWEIATGRCG